MPLTVFASHASVDLKVGKKMAKFFNDLQDLLIALGGPKFAGKPIFADYKDIKIGDKWDDKLADMVTKANAFLFMVSPWFENSAWCGRELSVALARHVDWSAKPSRKKQSSFLFPVLWEVSPIQEQAKQGLVPDALSAFHFDPPGTSSAYKEKGLRGMMTDVAHRSKVPAFIDAVARAMVAGLAHDEFPPHPEIKDFEAVPLPAGWPGASTARPLIPFEAFFHVRAPGDLEWTPQAAGAPLRSILETAATGLAVPMHLFDAKAKGLASRVKTAAEARQIFVVIADAVTAPDQVIEAINNSPSPLHLAFLLVNTGSSPGTTLQSWLNEHGLAGMRITEASSAGTAVMSSPASLRADLEITLQKARSAAMAAQPATAAEDPQAAQKAENGGVPVIAKPFVTGPGGNR